MAKTASGPLPIELRGPARLYAFDVDTSEMPVRVRLVRDNGAVVAECLVLPLHSHLPETWDNQPTWVWSAGLGEACYVPVGTSVSLVSTDPDVISAVGYLNYSEE